VEIHGWQFGRKALFAIIGLYFDPMLPSPRRCNTVLP
jgi:hypothetical protein